jgi:aminopeptidase N
MSVFFFRRARFLFILFLFCFVLAAAGPARERPAAWRVDFADLKVEIDPGHGQLRGDARLRLKSLGSGAEEVPLELNHELVVLSVTDGTDRPLDYDRNGGNLTIHRGQRSSETENHIVRVRYQGSFSERVPELDFFNSWVGPDISYALYAGLWYPQMPGPARRTKGKISFFVPGNWTVASVGKLTAEKILPSGKQYDFEVASPVAYSFAAAPFRSLRRNIEGLNVGVFLLGGGPEKAEYYLENCGKIVRFLKDLYGFFPYDGYSVIEFPQDLLGNTGGGSYEGITFYIPGAMPDRFFYLPVFGHEIGHLWWGNFVRGVEGPVINEGLAQLSMALYLEQAFGETTFRTILKNGAPELLLIHSARSYFQALQSPAASDRALLGLLLRGEDLELGIPSPTKRNTLHMLANSKGCFVFMMLRDLIGGEAFRAGLRGALARFAWKSMTLADLRGEFEKAAGRDLKWFFDQWFFRKGAPEFVLSYAAEAQGADWVVKGQIRQIRDVYRTAAEIVFVKDGARQTRVVEIGAEETGFSFVLPFKPDAVLFDPDYKILRWTDEFKI